MSWLVPTTIGGVAKCVDLLLADLFGDLLLIGNCLGGEGHLFYRNGLLGHDDRLVGEFDLPLL